MAFLVPGLASAAPLRVDGTQMIATSSPGFADLMRRSFGRSRCGKRR